METVYKWYEEKPNLYQAEINTLNNGLDGIFKLIKLFDPRENNNRIAAWGTITLENGEEKSVQIVFPAKYPSAAPNNCNRQFVNG